MTSNKKIRHHKDQPFGKHASGSAAVHKRDYKGTVHITLGHPAYDSFKEVFAKLRKKHGLGPDDPLVI